MKITALLSSLSVCTKSVAVGLSLTVVLLTTSVVAQNRGNAPQQGPTVQPTGDRSGVGVLVAPDEDYRIAPGDTIEIHVEDAPELQTAARVSAAGVIELNFLGAVTAQGKTVSELTRFIAQSLREQDYLKRPQVRVSIKAYGSNYFFIQGAVRTPGVYQIEGRPALIKLISMAGGLNDNHGPVAVILRPLKTPKNKADAAQSNAKAANLPAGLASTETDQVAGSAAAEPAKASGSVDREGNDEYEMIKVNLTTIYQQGRFDQNIKIEPGDIVNIPIANVFFVAGEVNAPGSFPLKEGTTLRQAISLAQGTTFEAALKNGVIFRDDPQSGKREEIRMDVGAVMSGKKEDILIFPNDVIIVPNSRAKSVSSALLKALGVNSARVPMRY